MMIHAETLKLSGLRHAFFTREGGVSGGLYQGLNGGLGSSDNPANVLENRRRMAERIGVLPENFLSLHQVHSPDTVVAHCRMHQFIARKPRE